MSRTITYGHGYLTDCDDVSQTFGGFTEDWSVNEHEDGDTAALTVTDGDFFTITVTVAAGNKTVYYEYPDSAGANNLSLPQSVYKEILFRYKTSSSTIKAKIVLVFSDAATQTVLAETSSTSWVNGSVEITSGKTVDHIQIWATQDTGIVYYDFILIHQGTFTIPYVSESTKIGFHNEYAKGLNPTRQGAVTQYMGTASPFIELVGDMDTRTSWVDSATYIGQRFFEIWLNADTEDWQWFETSDPPFKGKVVMEDFEISAVAGTKKKRLWRVLLTKFDRSSGTSSLYSGLEWLGL